MPPLPPDHLADVVGRDVEPEDDRVVTLLRLDAHGVRLVDEPPRDPLEELGQLRKPGDAGGLDQPRHGLGRLRALASQSLTFASSSSIVEGSVCGL